LTQHVAIEEEHRAEGLILRRRGHTLVDGQRRHKSGNLRCTQVTWVPHAMEADVTPNPVRIGLFGPPAVLSRANLLAHALEQISCHSTTMPSSSRNSQGHRKKDGWGTNE